MMFKIIMSQSLYLTNGINCISPNVSFVFLQMYQLYFCTVSIVFLQVYQLYFSTVSIAFIQVYQIYFSTMSIVSIQLYHFSCCVNCIFPNVSIVFLSFDGSVGGWAVVWVGAVYPRLSEWWVLPQPSTTISSTNTRLRTRQKLLVKMSPDSLPGCTRLYQIVPQVSTRQKPSWRRFWWKMSPTIAFGSCHLGGCQTCDPWKCMQLFYLVI